MRYRAFISYSSIDRSIGERFQRAIERYKIPKALRGIDHGFGPVPTRLTPLFRDRSDADASASLAATLRAALEGSEALVVLCSPASARSPWVNQEIRTFKALGRTGRIFPLLVDGAPRRFDAERSPEGAFPPALFERVDASGTVIANDDPEPLAADVRDSGDGFHLARLKVVAGLTGVPLTVLAERQLEAERRERIIVRSVAAVMAILALAASVAAVMAWKSAEDARLRLGETIEIASRGLDDTVRLVDEYGVPIAVIRTLLSAASNNFTELIGEGEISAPTLELQRGRLLVLFSSLYRAVGNTDREVTLARQGLATIERVPVARQLLRPSTWLVALPTPEDVTAERLGALEALAIALGDSVDGAAEASTVLDRGRGLASQAGRLDYLARFWSLAGEQRYMSSDVQGALAAHEAAIRTHDAAIAAAGSPAGNETVAAHVIERALARSERASVLLESERHQEAMTEQARAVRELEAHAAAAPGDIAGLRNLANTLTRQAEVQYAVSGSWTRSIPDFERALMLFERIQASDKARVDYGRDLSIALERLGDAMLQLNDVGRAGALFDRSIELRRERLARDPSSGDAVRDLAVGLERQSDVALAARRPERALAFLNEARALRTTPETRDAPPEQEPIRARDLAVLWWKTGAARLTLGQREPWSDAFETAIRLMAPLVAREDALPGWHRDLAVFRSSFAEALSRAGRSSEARTQWTAALALIEQQLLVNPDDPRLQEDRTVLLQRLGRAGRK